MTQSERYHLILERIARRAQLVGRRPEEVTLVAVSKYQPLERIQELYALGQRAFAENRVQSLLERREALPMPDIRWHLIGHLQRNKARMVVPFAAMIHSVDDLALARELEHRMTLALQAEAGAAGSRQGNPKLPVLLQVNISEEGQKQGARPEELEELVTAILTTCPHLELRGLMGMASNESDLERTRPQFRALRECRDRIQERHPELTGFTELSMGMSNDFEVAIEEGATIVRLGSVLFQDPDASH